MDISIIIALYNTEKYIEKCIQSVLDCPLAHSAYEIIVINDGSTDRSKLIVEQIISSNPEAPIKLINKENGGQSTARNIGFNMARGEYIFCLDSDDFLNGKEFKNALDYAISNNLDMLPIHYTTLNESHELVAQKSDNYETISEPITGGEFMNTFAVSGTMWRYFYKTKIIKEYNLKLIEGIYHEDEEFVLKYLCFVKKILYKRHKVYNYIIRSNSTINNKDSKHKRKLLQDLIVVIDSLSNLIINVDSSLIKKGLEKKRQQLILSIIISLYTDKIDKKTSAEIIYHLRARNYLPIKLKYLKMSHKMTGILINLYY